MNPWSFYGKGEGEEGWKAFCGHQFDHVDMGGGGGGGNTDELCSNTTHTSSVL